MTLARRGCGVSVSVVQGYVCFSRCDEAKARAGKNPHLKPDESEFAGRRIGSVSDPARADRRDGVSARDAAAPAGAPANASAIDARTTGRAVDILA
jgi:hypothetical protein